MDPITALAIGTTLSAGSQVMAGMERSKAAEFEATQLRIQEQQARTAAAQDEAKRRDELVSALETIQTIRAGRGVGLTSPGGLATLESVREDAERDIQTSKANYLTKADIARMGSEFADQRASTSLLAGFMGAGATVATGYGRNQLLRR